MRSPSPKPSPAGRGSDGEHTRPACGFRRLAGIIQRQLTARALGGAPKAAREGACAPHFDSFSLREKVAGGRMRVNGEFQVFRFKVQGTGKHRKRVSILECGAGHRFYGSFQFQLFRSSESCSSCLSMFSFLTNSIRLPKAAHSARTPRRFRDTPPPLGQARCLPIRRQKPFYK